MFESFQLDGEVGWRLTCQGNTLFLNCLVYTRWSEVWATAREIMAKVAQIGIDERDQGVQNLQLQYVDVFEWEGRTDEYDSRELLRAGSTFLSAQVTAGEVGHLWHHYSGWFESQDEPVPGQVLNRIHIDAVESIEGKPLVKFDATLRKDVVSPLPIAAIVHGPSLIDEVFSSLHEKNKALMAEYLSDQTLEKIGLLS